MAQVTDPRAVAMIWAVLVRGNERSRIAAVQMLGQIDGPSASNALAALAIFNPSPEIRARATETLARRDPRDVIGRLIGLVRKPFQYEVRKVDGPGSVGRLFVEGERFNLQRFYQDPPFNPANLPPRLFAPSVPFDPYNMQNMMLVSAAMNGMTITSTGPSPAAAQQAAQALAAHPNNAAAIIKNAAAAPAAAPNMGNNLVYQTLAQAAYRDMQIASAYQAAAQTTQNLQQQLASDIQTVEATNAGINELNNRVLPVLGMITGQDLGSEPEKWKAWWTDQLGYVYESNIPASKPTFTDRGDRDPVHGRHVPPGVLRGRHPGRHDRRSPRDRVDPGRRSRAVAGPHDRACSASGRSSPCTAIGRRRPCGSPSTARRSSPPASTASGRPARAGPWPAT